MEKNFQHDFENSLKALEDIQYLSEFSISPLIGQMYFYLSEMKRKMDAESIDSIRAYNQVARVLDQNCIQIVDGFFSDKTKFKEYDFIKSTQNISLKKWNLLLDIIPECLSVVSLFNYHGKVEIYLNENRLLISGHIRQDSKLEMSRKFVYVITRKLLKKKVLLTFKLEASGRTGLYHLDLKVDISHEDQLNYKVLFKLNSKQHHIISFSNVFCSYRSLLDDLQQIGSHHIIEINNDLSITHSSTVPDLNRRESANKEILHFPFLFRPVSLILPIKGHLSNDSFTRLLDQNSMNDLRSVNHVAPLTGLHEDLERKQDVSITYSSIDFFSLFNN